MKLVAMLAAMLALVACSEGTKSPVTMTVVEVYEDAAPLGCIGTNWNTFVRSDDNRVSRLCGRWGKPGDKIAGCWVAGHWDSINNGFRREC